MYFQTIERFTCFYYKRIFNGGLLCSITMTTEPWMITLQKVFYPLLTVIGIPSNIITFIIFWRRDCGVSPSCRCYMMAISVADTMVIIQIVIIEMILQYHTLEPFWSRIPWCMIRDVLAYGAYNSSVWLVVCFTIERFVAIKSCHLKPKFCTRNCTLCIIALVFICSYLFSVPYFWANESQKLNNTERYTCVYNTHPPTPIYAEGLVWFQTTFVYIVPYIIIFTLNGLILRQICQSNKVQCGMQPNHESSPSLRKLCKQKMRSVVLLVTVSMTFAYLCTTRFVTQIIIKTLHYGQERRDYTKAINVAADIGTMLDLSNTAINMYLYACTQARFRKELSEAGKALINLCRVSQQQKQMSVVFHISLSKCVQK
uniref:G-protein coupled receptors family 1 profile domain-containing protein n=1 Tax=Xenopus tropicalis TaxID=8364 RepID=A0A803JMX6_XENTR